MLGKRGAAFYRVEAIFFESLAHPPIPPCWTRVLDCIFCKIAAGDMPAKRVYTSEDVVVIHDINPQAAVHLLVIPKQHVSSMDDLRDPDLGGRLLAAARHVASEAGLTRGWRLITNIGEEGGQEIAHLHFHVLGGQPLGPMLSLR